ncbi:hypothetical protein Leryth_009355 [Lithospermum erythrorhizon]|nr:hypothetical protein Leryth_009355 [Lithospermum erythrorhizon]
MDKRIPSKMRVRTKHHLSQSPSPSPILRRRKSTLRKSSKSRVLEKNLLVLKRCKSEPILWRSEEIGGDDRRRRKMSPMIVEVEVEEEVLFRPQTCSDIFVSQDYVVSSSPRKSYEGSMDAKVLVSVTVEGSPGPIRTMVKLNCNVEEAISVVVRKYNAEGRTPPLKLIKNDDDIASNFELHSSYFSLESMF